MPRDHWLEAADKDAIIGFFQRHPLEGYRRLPFMMLDQDVVAVSPASVYRVLKKAGLLGNRWNQPNRNASRLVRNLSSRTSTDTSTSRT